MTFPEDKAKAIEADLATIKTEAVLVVKTETDNQNAAAFLGKVKARYNRLEQLRKEFVTPMNESVKKINARFKMFTEPLEELEGKVKSAMADFMKDKLAKAQAEYERQQAELRENEKAIALQEAKARKALDEAKSKKAKAEAEALLAKSEAERQALAPVMVEAPKATVRTEAGTVTAKKVWAFALEDIGQVPLEYLALDEKKVRRAIGDGTRTIAGVRIYQEIDISSRQI